MHAAVYAALYVLAAFPAAHLAGCNSCCMQVDLEQADSCSGKYTVGLGQVRQPAALVMDSQQLSYVTSFEQTAARSSCIQRASSALLSGQHSHRHVSCQACSSSCRCVTRSDVGDAAYCLPHLFHLQEAMTFCGDREDVVSMAATAVLRLLEAAGVALTDIGK